MYTENATVQTNGSFGNEKPCVQKGTAPTIVPDVGAVTKADGGDTSIIHFLDVYILYREMNELFPLLVIKYIYIYKIYIYIYIYIYINIYTEYIQSCIQERNYWTGVITILCCSLLYAIYVLSPYFPYPTYVENVRV